MYDQATHYKLDSKNADLWGPFRPPHLIMNRESDPS